MSSRRHKYRQADSSSSSSSSTSSSSVASGCSSSDTTECTPNRGGCADRKKCFTKTCEFLQVQAYEVDTCLLAYKPRLLKVPGKLYCDINQAFESMQPNHGGYVVYLKPGIHKLNRSLCSSVDYVKIIGDCNPLVGVPFIHGCCRVASSGGNYECTELHPCIGQGPYHISADNRRLTVRGRGGVNPDFSSLCSGRIISVLRVDGSLSQFEVASAIGNTITLTESPGLNNSNYSGEGFVIHPNVRIISDCDRVSIIPTHQLVFEGVELDMPTPFRIGTHGLYMDIRNCVLHSAYVEGYYYMTKPNAWLGQGVMTPASSGSAYHQGVLGRRGSILLDTNGGASWVYTVVSATTKGIKCQNGGKISTFGSDYFNNCHALTVAGQAYATIQGCVFCSNRVAVTAIYNSGVASYAVDGEEADQHAPQFYDNFYGISAGWQSHVIVPNVIMRKNCNAFIIDSRVYPTLESNPVGMIAQDGSIVLHAPNPFAVEGVEDSECVGASFQKHLHGTSFRGIRSVAGDASYSVNDTTQTQLCPCDHGNGINDGNGQRLSLADETSVRNRNFVNSGQIGFAGTGNLSTCATNGCSIYGSNAIVTSLASTVSTLTTATNGTNTASGTATNFLAMAGGTATSASNSGFVSLSSAGTGTLAGLGTAARLGSGGCVSCARR